MPCPSKDLLRRSMLIIGSVTSPSLWTTFKRPVIASRRCIALFNVDFQLNAVYQLGVNFIKRPSDGKMKHIAFVTDPDQ